MWKLAAKPLLAKSESVGTAADTDIDPFLLFDDQRIDELIFDGARNFWIVQSGSKRRGVPPFPDTESLTRWVTALARAGGVRLDPVVGSAGGSVGDGAFRWHCLLPPMAIDGPLVCIRRHRLNLLTIDHFLAEPDVVRELRHGLDRSAHFLIAGPTGSGKTTLLAALVKLLPPDERVFLIESVPEIGAFTPGVIRLTARAANLEKIGEFGLARVLAESLRLLPDRIVVGEVRSDEASVLIDAMRTGHQGVLATIHAGSGSEALARLTSLAGLPDQSWRQDLTADLLVVCTRRGLPPAIVRIERL